MSGGRAPLGDKEMYQLEQSVYSGHGDPEFLLQQLHNAYCVIGDLEKVGVGRVEYSPDYEPQRRPPLRGNMRNQKSTLLLIAARLAEYDWPNRPECLFCGASVKKEHEDSCVVALVRALIADTANPISVRHVEIAGRIVVRNAKREAGTLQEAVKDLLASKDEGSLTDMDWLAVREALNEQSD